MSAPHPRCVYCGQRVAGDDSGGWLHLTESGMPGSHYCPRTVATPPEEFERARDAY